MSMKNESEHEEENFEEHSSHEHGHANANISFVNQLLIVKFVLPSIDVFGFEHLPRDEPQHQTVANSKTKLENVSKVFNIYPEDDCEIDNIALESIIFEPDKNHHEEDHHDYGDEVHSDVTAEYTYNCKTSNLDAIEFVLFDSFPSLKEIKVQYVSAQSQSLYTASSEKRSHSLK